MKAEEFDQYVRAQFENEIVAPPANLEGAVFATLAAKNRKRRIVSLEKNWRLPLRSCPKDMEWCSTCM